MKAAHKTFRRDVFYFVSLFVLLMLPSLIVEGGNVWGTTSATRSSHFVLFDLTIAALVIVGLLIGRRFFEKRRMAVGLAIVLLTGLVIQLFARYFTGFFIA